MAGILKEAGLKNIRETTIDTVLKCETNDVYWNMHTEVGAPIVAALSKADDAMKAKIKSDTYQQLDEKFAGKPVNPEASAIIIYGEKP